jgi:hypothetical protein
VRQDDQALRRQLNQTILGWHDNGQIDTVLDAWVSTRQVTLQLR